MGRYRLELEWAGEVHTFSDELSDDIAITNAVGIEDRSTAEPATVDVQVDFGFDVPARIEAGYELVAARGELYLDDVLLMTGRVVGAQYGDPTEPVGFARFSVREATLDDTALVPPVTHVVNDDTWPNHDPAVTGRVYPQIFGRPGAATPSRTGSPGYLLHTGGSPQYILVAGHPVNCDQVTLVSVNEDTSVLLSVIHTIDGLGQTVAVVNLIGSGLDIGAATEGYEYWVIWSDPEEPQSGDAGDVLRNWLSSSSLRQDPGRVAVAASQLQRYKLAFYVDERVRPMDWIGDNMLSVLPFTFARSAEGIYPVVLEPARSADVAVAHLEAGPACSPTSPVDYQAAEPLSEVSLDYAVRARSGEYTRVARAYADRSLFAAMSRTRHATRGVHVADVVDALSTDIIDNNATAQAIAALRLRLAAARWRTASYRVDRGVYGHVEPAHWVTITDPDRSWTSKLAWVSSRTDDLEGMELTLAIESDPTRD